MCIHRDADGYCPKARGIVQERCTGCGEHDEDINDLFEDGDNELR